MQSRSRGAPMLIVFDVDGTLTRTEVRDAELYVQAFAEVHGVRLEEAEWRACRCISDRGIAEEVLARRLGRSAAPGEVGALRDRFLGLLAQGLGEAPEALAVPGAAAALGRLRADGHALAIATGCWRASAELKLARAAISVTGLPLATCDDHAAREAIVALAIARAGGRGRHERVVYVGDGAWDVLAARRLGLPFVGVDHAGTGRLIGLGVPVVRDFGDLPAFVDAVVAARPPA